MGKVSSEIRTVKRQLMLEEWEKQVIDCRSSGLTVQEWCRQNGVNDKTYYYHLRQVREKCLEARAEKAEKTSEQENIQAVVPLPMKSAYGEIQIEKTDFTYRCRQILRQIRCWHWWANDAERPDKRKTSVCCDGIYRSEKVDRRTCGNRTGTA